MSELAQTTTPAATDPLDPLHPLASQPLVSDAARLSDHLGGQRIAMLATVEEDGSVDSRPMTLVQLDAQGRLWFFCEQRPGDETVAARHRRVNLSFSDEVRSVFVSITGRGELQRDEERIRALWTAQARWDFPEGPVSERLVLLKVTPERVRLWEAPPSELVQGGALSVGG